MSREKEKWYEEKIAIVQNEINDLISKKESLHVALKRVEEQAKNLREQIAVVSIQIDTAAKIFDALETSEGNQ